MGLFELSCTKRLVTAVCRGAFAPVWKPGKANVELGIDPETSAALGLRYVELGREIGGAGTS